MIHRDNHENGDLILSNDRSLASNRLGLVKQGLDLVRKINKHHIDVLIGNFDDPINDLISELIKEIVKTKNKLNIKCLWHGEDILEQAEKGSVDIFIIIANNITQVSDLT